MGWSVSAAVFLTHDSNSISKDALLETQSACVLLVETWILIEAPTVAYLIESNESRQFHGKKLNDLIPDFEILMITDHSGAEFLNAAGFYELLSWIKYEDIQISFSISS